MQQSTQRPGILHRKGQESGHFEVARMIWMLQASYSIDITFEHIAGSDNVLADSLSRAYSSNAAAGIVGSAIRHKNIRGTIAIE